MLKIDHYLIWNVHCENKLTTEWLPWLQTNWRDSGYERVRFGIEDEMDSYKVRAAQFILQPY